MTNSVSHLMVITLALILFLAIGGAIPAVGASNSDTPVAPTVTLSEEGETGATGGAFGTNVSAPSQSFERAEQDFDASSDALENRSESLRDTAKTIQANNAYTDADHEQATDDLDVMENELQALDEAESDARDEVVAADADLSPTEQFLILEAIEAERHSTETTVDDALEEYETAVEAQQADITSPPMTYFGGALLVGLLGGAVLGAVIPLREAKKTGDKMKLSRNVSYNKWAGVIPVGVGVLIGILAVGLLWYLGAVDLIRVIL